MYWLQFETTGILGAIFSRPDEVGFTLCNNFIQIYSIDAFMRTCVLTCIFIFLYVRFGKKINNIFSTVNYHIALMHATWY